MEKPKKIIAIIDNPAFIDRYTVVLEPERSFKDQYECLGLSNDPTSPLGFSQFSSCSLDWLRENEFNKIDWSLVPQHIQKHIIDRLKE